MGGRYLENHELSSKPEPGASGRYFKIENEL